MKPDKHDKIPQLEAIAPPVSDSMIAEHALSLITHMEQCGETPTYHQKLRLGLIDSINVALVHIFTIHATGSNNQTQYVPHSVVEYSPTDEAFSVRLYPHTLNSSSHEGQIPHNLEITEALDDFTERLDTVLELMEREDEEGMGLDVGMMEDAPNYTPVIISRGSNNLLKIDFDDALQAIAFLEALVETLEIDTIDHHPQRSLTGLKDAGASFEPDENAFRNIPAGIYASPFEAFARSADAQQHPRTIYESLERLSAIAMEIEGLSAEMPSAYNLQ